jgi:prepilin-type processing-associated H-X9-DG protein
MGEGCLGALLILFLLPIIRAVVCIHRLVNPHDRGRKSAARELLGCCGWFLACGLAIALILPAFPAARESAHRSQCANHLKQIHWAMYNYHEVHGCFPPAYTVDKNGRPLHSWRVLLLPYLEQAELYKRIRLDEPYDSPHNRAVFDSTQGAHDGLGSMPFVFRCPSDKQNGIAANYVMLVGPRTISNGPNSVHLKDISDGTSSTIAVVETYGLGIRWYEPRDLRVGEMSFRINDPEHYGIASHHPGGAQAGFADGSARYLADTTDPRTVEAMTTINGGEDVGAALR